MAKEAEQLNELTSLKEELLALQQSINEQREILAKEVEDAKAEKVALAEETAKLMAAKTALDEAQSKAGVKKVEKPVNMVKVKLHKDKNVKRDVFVSVNGKTYQIQRGVEVEVPDFVKEVLDNMEKMDNLAMERVEQATRKFAE